MCGLIGVFADSQINFEKKFNILKHRGPDSYSYKIFKVDDWKLYMSHFRLSIIDLNEHANQPFDSHCGRYTIVYNGEIYNYQELRETLIAQGVNFFTESDTEVLLNHIVHNGLHALNQLDGMFAFALFDKQEEVLWLVRDQLGIKPLYYYTGDNNELMFASEIKAIKAIQPRLKLNTSALTEFLYNGWLYEPDTAYEKIMRVPPGSTVKYDLRSKTSEMINYFDLLSTPRETTKSLQELLTDSIKRQSYSDVKNGLFFSGGIDSSVLAVDLKDSMHALVARYDEDSLKQSGMSNDAHYASLIANYLGMKTEYLSLTPPSTTEFLTSIKHLAQYSEDLLCDYTFLPSQSLSKRARDLGYKVMLSGMGADELFAGYPRYNLVKYKHWYRCLLSVPGIVLLLRKKPSLAKKVDRLLAFFKADNFSKAYTSLIGYFNENEIKSLLGRSYNDSAFFAKLNHFDEKSRGLSPLKKALFYDLYGFLSHNFMVADKSSMLESIELRVPLATKDLFQAAMALPDSKLMTFTKTKRPLLERLTVLPKAFFKRKKAGFNPPFDAHINELGQDVILNEFTKQGLYKYLSAEAVQAVVRQHFSGKKNNTYKVFQLLYLEYWLQKHA